MVRGEKALNSYPWLIHIARRDGVGHTIPADSAGTLVQDTTRIHIMADTRAQLIERIDRANELFQMMDGAGAQSMRDVIAFPKVKDASDLMCDAPSFVDKKQLAELFIRTVPKEPKDQGGTDNEEI